jgi:hypothetical protein
MKLMKITLYGKNKFEFDFYEVLKTIRENYPNVSFRGWNGDNLEVVNIDNINYVVRFYYNYSYIYLKQTNAKISDQYRPNKMKHLKEYQNFLKNIN